jgi:hypothetical protein
MSVETIIQIFFHMLLNLKLYHWDTTQFARHKASDELHSSLSSLIDQFIEVYIGGYTRPVFPNSFNVKVKQFSDNNIIDMLNEYIDFLKHDIPKYVRESDTHLLNIRDEMLAEINKTLYLFTLQ